MNRKNKIIRSSAFYAGIAVFSAVLIVGNCIAKSYESIVTQYLNQESFKVVHSDKDEVVDDIYKSEFSSSRKLVREQKKYAETIQSEGSVLLINKDHTLPNRNIHNITLLGTGSADFVYAGGGSGAVSTLGTPNLKEAFENLDFKVNQKVWDLYTTGEGSKTRKDSSKVGEAPVTIFTDEIKSSFTGYSDAAIVVLSRVGSESGDLPLQTKEDTSKHMLQLSKNEYDIIKLAKDSGFKKVIVLLNTTNALQLNELESLGVDACLWVGAGGQMGINAIPKLITGDLVPTGRTVDTYARDFLRSPAMANFGLFTYNNTKNNYVSYQEGIYVGYKYYETRYEDSVLKQGNPGDYKYQDEVQYPFGYGLSYTTFEHSNLKAVEKEDSIEFSITTKNTGGIASKDVLELYLHSPYTDYDKLNDVEKSAVSLISFAKSDEIAPGKSQTLSIIVDKRDMASYDFKNKKTYILDKGEYKFAIGDNSHDALNNVLASLGKTTSDGMDYNGNSALVYSYNQKEFDDVTYSTSENGNKITNKLDDANINNYDESVKYLTRKDWTGTFPTSYSDITASDKLLEDLKVPVVDETGSYSMPTTSTISEKYGELSLVNLNGKPYDSELWDALLDQMSKEDMYKLVRTGGYSTAALTSINKPGTIDKDGPAGISSTLVGGKGAFGYPIEVVIASTYNKDLARRVGQLIGEDGYYTKTSGWYAPAMNIHRTPFAGRNFEYFSEDPILSGVFGAEIVKGCQEKGVYPYIKHFAFNDQETRRSGLATFTNEQAAREIYLKPFEKSITEGKSMGVMAAMNRIGATWVGHSKNLMTGILREEWGFKGMVITDQASFYSSVIADLKPTLAAGVDMMLCTNDTLWKIEDYDKSAFYMTKLRDASHNILYAVANSNAMNGQSSKTKIVKITPTWEKILFAADGILAVAIVTGLVFNTLSLRKALKEKEAE